MGWSCEEFVQKPKVCSNIGPSFEEPLIQQALRHFMLSKTGIDFGYWKPTRKRYTSKNLNVPNLYQWWNILLLYIGKNSQIIFDGGPWWTMKALSSTWSKGTYPGGSYSRFLSFRLLIFLSNIERGPEIWYPTAFLELKMKNCFYTVHWYVITSIFWRLCLTGFMNFTNTLNKGFKVFRTNMKISKWLDFFCIELSLQFDSIWCLGNIHSTSSYSHFSS